MAVMCTHGAGLDVSKPTVMACRVPPEPTGEHVDGVMERKAWGAMPVALLALADWWAAAGITPVAIERTGEAWQPLEHRLAGELTVFLVNAGHGKQGPGRQADQADARWWAQRRRDGGRRASFLPARHQRDWRALTRDRTTVVPEHSREVQRVQGVLERANITLASVATAMRGGRPVPSWLRGSRAGRLRRPWRSSPNGGGGARCRGGSRR
jgi:transposase